MVHVIMSGKEMKEMIKMLKKDAEYIIKVKNGAVRRLLNENNRIIGSGVAWEEKKTHANWESINRINEEITKLKKELDEDGQP